MSTCRNYAGGSIPYTAVVAYIVSNDIDEDQAELLIAVVEKVDIWFLDFVEKYTAKKNENKAQTKPRRKIGKRK